MCLCDVLSQISGDTVPLISTEIHIICNQESLPNLYVRCAHLEGKSVLVEGFVLFRITVEAA
jgi:hypothetical protein